VVVLLILYLQAEQEELSVVLYLKQHFTEDFVMKLLFKVSVEE
jgi:hypothetical protein